MLILWLEQRLAKAKSNCANNLKSTAPAQKKEGLKIDNKIIKKKSARKQIFFCNLDYFGLKSSIRLIQS
jgi:7-keto-8-aminopelargonate synthetase-like enzyme